MNTMKFGANAYVKANVDTGVATAHPHQLIAMLLDGAIHCINRSRYFLDKGDIRAKCAAITHACEIVDNGLRVSVDFSANPEFAGRLVYLYRYVVMRLIQANLNNDREKLAEALKILSGLRDAWAQISPDRRSVPPVAESHRAENAADPRKGLPARRQLTAYIG
jgi:flagellar protein FliS